MDQRYDAYCMVDPDFYESPTELEEENLDFTVVSGPLPDGWQQIKQDDWRSGPCTSPTAAAYTWAGTRDPVTRCC